MQRLQKHRYGVNNPFGDKVQVKFRMTGGSVMSGNGTDNYVQATGAFNDLSQAENDYSNCPGFFIYPTLFNKYRVTGVKIRFTPMSLTGVNIGYIMGSNGILTAPTMDTLPEQRWCRYKPLNFYTGGGTTKSISMYLSSVKVAGGDRTTSNDEDYTSTTNTSAPYYNAVPNQIGYQYGVMSVDGNALSGQVANYIISMTYYVTFWDRRTPVAP